MHLSSARISFTATLSRPLNCKCNAFFRRMFQHPSIPASARCHGMTLWSWSAGATIDFVIIMGLCHKSILVPTDSTSSCWFVQESISKSGWSRIPGIGREVLGWTHSICWSRTMVFQWLFPRHFSQLLASLSGASTEVLKKRNGGFWPLGGLEHVPEGILQICLRENGYHQF